MGIGLGIEAQVSATRSVTRRLGWLERRSTRHAMRMALVYALLSVAAFVVMIPLAWMVSTSLKESTQVFTWPIAWFPNPIRVANYPEALSARPFWLWMRNTLLVAVLCVVGGSLSALCVGYAFSRLRWSGRDILFVLVLATMMLPHQVTMIPRFIIFSKMGWVNTFLPLFVPSFFGAAFNGAFNVFVVRQFLLTLRAELDDAAKLDGCGYLGILLHVLLPQALPPLGFVAINSFRVHWNDFLQPLIYLNRPSLFTLPLGLRSFISEYAVEWGWLMAASVVALLPLLLVFFVGQRYFIQGVAFTGVEK